MLRSKEVRLVRAPISKGTYTFGEVVDGDVKYVLAGEFPYQIWQGSAGTVAT